MIGDKIRKFFKSCRYYAPNNLFGIKFAKIKKLEAKSVIKHNCYLLTSVEGDLIGCRWLLRRGTGPNLPL